MYQTNLESFFLRAAKIGCLEEIKRYNLSEYYLRNNKNVIDKALTQYPRLMGIRFDLHFPKMYFDIDYCRQNATSEITLFLKSLQAKINSNIYRRRRNGKRVADCDFSYIWVKEGDDDTEDHYHVVIFLNSDTYNSIGKYSVFGDNLYTKIVEAWASALSLDRQDAQCQVHFPNNCIYYLKSNSRNFEEVYRALYKRLSYFAKVETKSYGDKQRSYGCSRKR